MIRTRLTQIGVVLAAGLAIMALTGCDEGYRITVDRAILFPTGSQRMDRSPLELEFRQDTFEVPPSTSGILRVDFSSGTRYSQCTLSFGASRLLDVHDSGGGGLYVEMPVPGMARGRSQDGSLTCVRTQGLATPFSDTFRIVVKDDGYVITARPPEVYYSKTPIGRENSGTPVVITNLGSSPITITDIMIAGPGAAAFRRGAGTCRDRRIPAGGQCTVLIVFRPQALGVAEATLQVASSPARRADTVQLVGTGVPVPVPVAILSMTDMIFGEQTVGTSSAQTISVRNDGSALLTLSAVALNGDVNWFWTSTDTCSGRSLEPNQTCIVTVVFAPQSGVFRRAELVVASNAKGSPHTVGITGFGVVATPPPTCSYPYC